MATVHAQGASTSQPLQTQEPGEGWDRRRLLGVAAIGAVLVLLLAVGLVYAVVWTLRTTTADTPATDTPLRLEGVGTASQRRDAIAADPMPAVPPQAATGGTPAADPGPTMSLPAPTTVGPADVPTGYPQSPPGAVAQLASITTSVLSVMSVGHARAVHQGWATPGAPPAQQWVMTANVAAFLTAAGVTGPDPAVVVTAAPAAAQVKGVDGTDWVLACVLLDVQATVTAQARVGYGHCEQMQWDTATGRWVIGAGEQPARAPSTAPGTQEALDAGWVTIAPAGQD